MNATLLSPRLDWRVARTKRGTRKSNPMRLVESRKYRKTGELGSIVDPTVNAKRQILVK